MEPRIQYATTSDGVSIAYAVLGEGLPIVFAASVFGTLYTYSSGKPTGGTSSLASQLAARGWQVILYDGQGCGHSERTAADFRLEARLSEVEAVIGTRGLDRFVLLGGGAGGMTAIAHAARYPERISHLVLVNTYARGADYGGAISTMRASRAMMRGIGPDAWEFYTLTVANAVTGFSDSELARRNAEIYRAATSLEAYLAYSDASDEIDVTPLLASVSAPTLVVHDKTSKLGDFSPLARNLAGRIAGARLVSTEDVATAIDGFLREGERSTELAAALPHGTATILFADIADSTALTERMGDAVFRAKAGELDAALRAIVRDCAGTPVEGRLVGDGLMAVFTSSHQAIACALYGVEEGSRIGLPLHLGIHAGDVSREGNNVYGGAVNIAARVAAASAAGEILVSDVVRTLARTSAGVAFEDRGEHSLKGVAEPQRLWAVCGGK
jgi:class 3 adenylate cyclase